MPWQRVLAGAVADRALGIGGSTYELLEVTQLCHLLPPWQRSPLGMTRNERDGYGGHRGGAGQGATGRRFG
jgi:hypothetical protein